MKDKGIDALIDEAYTLVRQSHYKEAEKKFKEALDLFPDHDSYSRAQCFYLIAECALNQGDNAKARRYFNKSLHLSHLEKNFHGEACCLCGLARCSKAEGNYREAEALYKNAIGLFKQDRMREGSFQGYSGLCSLLLKLNRYDDCRSYSHDALLYLESGLSALEGPAISFYLGKTLDIFEFYATALLKSGQDREAYEILAFTKESKAVKGLNMHGIENRNLSKALRAIELGKGFLYDEIVQKLPIEDTAIIDFYILEMGTVIFILQKGRDLKDAGKLLSDDMGWAYFSNLIEHGWLRSYHAYQYFMKAEERITYFYRLNTEYLLSSEFPLEYALDQLTKRVPDHIKEDLSKKYPSDEDKGILSGVDLLSDILKEVFKQIETNFQELIDKRKKQGGPPYLFDKEANDKFHEGLGKLLKETEEKLHAQRLAKLCEVLKDLHDNLFEKSGLLGTIRGKVRKVIFILTRELFLVPLHAAFSDVKGVRRYILQDFQEIRYLPSIFFYRPSPGKEAPKQAGLVLSKNEGDLPFGEREFYYLKNSLQGIQVIDLCGREVTEENLKSLLNNPLSKFIYIGHARYSMVDPEKRSGLLIPDGEGDYNYFTIEMLKKINMNIDTVILKGCETAMSSLQKRDEYLGFPRLFLEKGAQRVLATCWEVSDEVSYYMSTDTSHALTRDSAVLLPAVLLRVQESMIRGEVNSDYQVVSPSRCADPDSVEPSATHIDYNHPFYWAPFVYYGI